MISILSFPERGPYGKASWRGNTSGYILGELLKHYKPKLFVDPAEGSGTSRDVSRELGIEYRGFDLHSGFNLLKDNLLRRLPRYADYVFFHPPYYNIIAYSGGVWGKTPHPDDLSRCGSPEEFLQKLEIALLNIYEAVCKGGNYSVLVGDVRKNGWYWSLQSDIIQFAPGKLEGIVIKAQHNCDSADKNYAGRFIPIYHEYILNFKKGNLVVSLLECATTATKRLSMLHGVTWKAVIETALQKLGGKASLDEIYELVSKEAEEKIKLNPQHWKDKIRQVLQKYAFPLKRGVWGLNASAA